VEQKRWDLSYSIIAPLAERTFVISACNEDIAGIRQPAAARMKIKT
jgi:hypothetical protein